MKLKHALLALVLLCGCARSRSAAPAASQLPLQSPATPVGTIAPAAAPAALPSIAPAPLAPPVRSPAPQIAAPAAQPLPLVAPPEAAPQFISVAIAPTVVRSGDLVSGAVVTTSNVASVEARIERYGVSLNHDGPGRFSLVYRVPNLPRFLSRTYTLVLTARTADGRAAVTERVITVR